MPPCSVNLQLHIARSAYLANIYRNVEQLQMRIQSRTDHGWDAKENVTWSVAMYRGNVSDILLDSRFDESSDEDLTYADASESSIALSLFYV